jgi:hypothetical protein
MDVDKSLKIIQANIRRKMSRRKSSSSKNSVFVEDYIKSSLANSLANSSANSSANSLAIANANKISKFLKSKLIVDKYTLDNRVAYFNYIRKKLEKIRDDDCLDRKKYSHSEGYTVRDILNLEKKISSNNFGGEIYRTSVKNAVGVFPIASKIMNKTDDNLYEVKLMSDITSDIIRKKISKHFLIMYKSCLCEKKDYSNSRASLVSVNEIANGDINMLINNRDVIFNKELLYNILFQTFISIGTFHNLIAHIHSDCHGGNFLWHYNNESGYYHYIFNGKNLYLKACKYNIMIYDYAFSKKIKKNNVKKIMDDYLLIIPAFLNEDYENDKSLSPDSNVKNELNEIIGTLMKVYKTMGAEGSKSSPKKIQKDIFSTIINEVFKKYQLNDMFITDFDSGKSHNHKSSKRPRNIINKKPYYINI